MLVDTRDAQVDVPAAERRRDEHEPGPGGERDFGVFRMLDPTLGHERTEWRIEPGTRLTVIGEARLHGDEVRIAASPEQPLTMTASERSDHIEGGRTGSRAAVRRAAGYAAGAVLVLVVVVLL